MKLLNRRWEKSSPYSTEFIFFLPFPPLAHYSSLTLTHPQNRLASTLCDKSAFFLRGRIMFWKAPLSWKWNVRWESSSLDKSWPAIIKPVWFHWSLRKVGVSVWENLCVDVENTIKVPGRDWGVIFVLDCILESPGEFLKPCMLKLHVRSMKPEGREGWLWWWAGISCSSSAVISVCSPHWSWFPWGPS